MAIHRSRYLYEDDHLLAVSKRSGELVVRGKGAVGKLPLFDLLKKDHPDLRVLHRLDFETSGVILFAKGKRVYEAVREQDFASWQKVYQTLVMGRMGKKPGIIKAPLPARGQGLVKAVTHYRVLEQFANSSLIELEIATGRYHQIRRHLAHVKHPLALDEVYGHKKFNRVFKQEFGYRTFFLHAVRLELKHPVTGEQLKIEAPLPKNFSTILECLRTCG